MLGARSKRPTIERVKTFEEFMDDIYKLRQSGEWLLEKNRAAYLMNFVHENPTMQELLRSLASKFVNGVLPTLYNTNANNADFNRGKVLGYQEALQDLLNPLVKDNNNART